MSSRVNERQDGGSTPKRGRNDAAPQHMEPSPGISAADSPAELHDNDPPLSGTPALPKTKKQCYCLACGDTSTHQFRSAPVGFKVSIVLLLGEEFKNFNGQVDVCRACERACGPVLAEECEALLVSMPTSTSTAPLKLPAPLQLGLRLRKQLSVLREDFALRGSVALYEKLLAMNPKAPSRFAGDQLILLPVPTTYTVHISNRYSCGYKCFTVHLHACTAQLFVPLTTCLSPTGLEITSRKANILCLGLKMSKSSCVRLWDPEC